LIGDLVYPEEVTMLFGRSGVGKSHLAIQFANAISKGIHLNLGNDIVLQNECKPIKVVFYDFELSQKQVQQRLDSECEFENFTRATLKRGEYINDDPKEVVEILKSGAKREGAKCIIIDNISAISGDIESSKNAVPFMQALMKLAKEEKYTVIVIAHTPKLREFTPIVLENLAGSNKVNQLTDGAVAIGKANTDNAQEVYIIHLKGRNGAKTYHKANVIHSLIKKENGAVCHVAQSLIPEIDLLNNFSISTEQAPNRELFVYAVLYYGSSRKASDYFDKAGLKVAHSTINDNDRKFREKNPKLYNEIKGFDSDTLKSMLDSKWDLPDVLELKKGHIPEDNNIPF
jgi:KaiC/GvpD/RAD55 family RecA-like ATPase